MYRKLGWFLLIIGIVAIFGELLSIQLPTLRWPFNTSRELDFLSIESGEGTEKKLIPVFGYFFCALLSGLGYYLIQSNPKNAVISPVTARRIQRFKDIRRGYISLWIILFLGFLASLDQLIVGNKALVVKYNDEYHFPALAQTNYFGKDFGETGEAGQSPAHYRSLKEKFSSEEGDNFIIMPIVPYNPTQDTVRIPVSPLKLEDGKLYRSGSNTPFNGLASTLYNSTEANKYHLRSRYRKGVKDGLTEGKDENGKAIYKAEYSQGKLKEGSQTWNGQGKLEDFLKLTDGTQYEILYYPSRPNESHLLGTNSAGNDLLAYLYGGLQVNFKAALFYIPMVYCIGISVGLLMGYFGGAFDLIIQRIIEVFSNIPFLFILIIISSSIPEDKKGLGMILLILVIFGWMGMTYLMRTAAYKEKARDYIAASRVLGASTPRIIFQHILPNTVAILVTLVPFSISGLVMGLTSLDYLGFGLPNQYATWGTLLRDGLDNLGSPWLVTSAFLCLVALLILITFVGEAVREAFDPKKFTYYK